MAPRRKLRLLKAAGVGLCLLFAFLFCRDEVGMSGNESGRFALIQAVGEQGVFYIENTNFRTVDRVIRDFHVYYDKPPALSWGIGMIYRFFHRWFGINFVDHYYLSVFAVNFVFGAAVNSLLFLWMFNLLRGFRRGKVEWKFLLALASVFSTWILSYSVVINNHTAAALAVLGCFVALRKFDRKAAAPAALLAGAAAGAAGAVDLTAGAFLALAIFVFAFAGRPRWRFLFLAAGTGAAALLLLLGLNYYAYGTAVPLYIAGSTGTFHLDPGKRDLPEYIFQTLLGTRGIFSYMPLLLFAAPGFPFRKHSRSDLAAGTVIAAFFIFYLGFTNEYGGYAYGFRYLIPTIPLLWFYAARWVLRSSAVWKSVLVSFLILWGVVASLVGAYQPFCVSFEGYRSPPGSFTRAIRSSFCGNLLCILYQYYPDAPATKKLIEHYGHRVSGYYLYYSFFGMKELGMLARIRHDFPELGFK